MTIEEAGPNPERLATAIHFQLDHKAGPVPVREIATALDIVDIREKPLKSFEGALVTAPERDVGMILVNSGSSLPRRRYTLSHELGHFLNLWHKPQNSSDRFVCTKADLATSWREKTADAARHRVQESEANRFAIELLAPRRLIRPYLRGLPDLAKVVGFSDALLLSREAGARRYVELHEQPCGLVFSRAGEVRYVERDSDFPFISYGRSDRVRELPPSFDASGLSAHVEVDPRDWLRRPEDRSLVAQTLHQSGGYAITLLSFDDDLGSDDDI
jgi:IrrE N-terminal-like domain